MSSEVKDLEDLILLTLTSSFASVFMAIEKLANNELEVLGIQENPKKGVCSLCLSLD